MNTSETKTDTSKWGGNFEDLKEFSDIVEQHKETVVPTPIFILFAEYMGYVSQFNKKAEDWCDGKVPDEFIQKIINVEARCILHQMKKDYTVQTMRYWFNTYYPVVIKEIEDKIANK